VVLGGLLVSTIFTLVLVPTMFILSMESRQRFWTLLQSWLGQVSTPEPASPGRPAQPVTVRRHDHRSAS
jgi:hypothetical protein